MILRAVILTLALSVQGEAVRERVKTTPAGKSALAVIFGTNSSYAIVAPYGRYTVSDAPFDVSEIRLLFGGRSIVKQFKEETEIYIQNNTASPIKRIEFRVDVYDRQRRKLLDTLYVSATDTFKPNSRGRGYLYLSNFRASGDLFLLFMATKAEMADGAAWTNQQAEGIAENMQQAVENDALR